MLDKLLSWRLAQVTQARREQRDNSSSTQAMNCIMVHELWSSLWSKLCQSCSLPCYDVVTSGHIENSMCRCTSPHCFHPTEVCGTTAALCYNDLCWRTRASLNWALLFLTPLPLWILRPFNVLLSRLKWSIVHKGSYAAPVASDQ